MKDAPILICYDGSAEAEGAIDTAAALFGKRRAVGSGSLRVTFGRSVFRTGERLSRSARRCASK